MDDFQRFWAALPRQAVHPQCVSMLEAIRWVREALSAVDIVDLLEGEIDMWEAARHLVALEELGVLEARPVRRRRGQRRTDGFDAPYRLKLG